MRASHERGGRRVGRKEGDLTWVSWVSSRSVVSSCVCVSRSFGDGWSSCFNPWLVTCSSWLSWLGQPAAAAKVSTNRKSDQNTRDCEDRVFRPTQILSGGLLVRPDVHRHIKHTHTHTNTYTRTISSRTSARRGWSHVPSHPSARLLACCWNGKRIVTSTDTGSINTLPSSHL